MNSVSSASTSIGLIRQVQANDPEAWRRLCQLYTGSVYGWCKQAGLQNADIADVVQNVFTSVHRGIVNFKRENPSDSFRGWLWTITRNEIRGHFRRISGQPHATGGSEAHMAIQQIPDFIESDTGPPNANEDQALIHRALRLIQTEFEVSTWQAFWRVTVDGLSGPEVAEELGMSTGAVRQAKYRVLHRLREFLSDD